MEAVVEEWMGSGNGTPSNNSGSGDCLTSKMHSEWVLKVFDQCIETPLQYVAFFIGLSSIICWLLAQAPQLITNCRYGIADKALSFWFLLQWFLGDATNLIGALLTHQLATQTATAVYFVLIDTVMMGQFVYYVLKNQGVRGLLSCFKCPKDGQVVAIFLPGLMCTMLLASWPHLASHVGGGAMGGAYSTEEGRVGRVLLYHQYDLQSHKDEPVIDVHDPKMFIGYLIGCVSAALYVGSRVPQIVKNFTRCSVDGVSLPMFILAVMGNVTYALGIFLYSVDGKFLLQKLPWLVGSVGTLCFDFTIFSQFIFIRCLGITCGRTPREEGKPEDEERRPLIDKSADGATLPCFSQKGSIQVPRKEEDVIKKDEESSSSSDESVEELILSRYELPHHHHHPHHPGHCPPGHHHHEHQHHDHHHHDHHHHNHH